MFSFSTAGTSFAVSNLDTGTVPPVSSLTNIFSGPDGIALHRLSLLNKGINAAGAFSVAPNSTNDIQSATSPTPLTVWQNVSTNVADAGGAWQFTDGNNIATRFYRSYAP